jgi:phospholipid:diacylglycerol acyltransferase
VAGGKGDTITNYVVSNIKEYASRVKIYDDNHDKDEEDKRKS